MADASCECENLDVCSFQELCRDPGYMRPCTIILQHDRRPSLRRFLTGRPLLHRLGGEDPGLLWGLQTGWMYSEMPLESCASSSLVLLRHPGLFRLMSELIFSWNSKPDSTRVTGLFSPVKPVAVEMFNLIGETMYSFTKRVNICGEVCRWRLPTHLCHFTDRQDRWESFLRVDMLNSCRCDAKRDGWKAHLCTRSISINISHVQKLWGGAQFVMKRRYHQSLSARNIELPLPLTLMANPSRDGGWPTWSSAAILVDTSYAPPLEWGGKGCGGVSSMTKTSLLFKTELGAFVLWLSRRWSAVNPWEDWASEGRRWTPNHTMTMRTCSVSRLRWEMAAPLPGWAPHLTSDSSNHEGWQCHGRCQFFFRWRKMSRAAFLVSPLEEHEYLLPAYLTLNETLKIFHIQKLLKQQ